MSGSSNRGGGPWRPKPLPSREITRGDGGPSGEGEEVGAGRSPCDIVELTNLNSPNATVLRTLKVGDVLDVQFRTGPPARLVAVTPRGSIAGSITSASMLQLIQCIGAGWNYEAEILQLSGGMCQVELRAK
jgi:hypothetical protein